MSIFAAPSFYSQEDQDIYNQGNRFITQAPFRGSINMPGIFPPPVKLPVNDVKPLTAAFNRGGGEFPFTGGLNDLVPSFQKTVGDRQTRLNRALEVPSTIKIGGIFPAFKQDVNPVDAGEYLAAGQNIPQQRTLAGKMFQPQSAQEIMEQGYEEPSSIGIISALLSKADKFGTLPRPDQAFIANNMGYTGPTVFGENTTGGSKDPFGLNVRSGFGNYAERVGTEATELRESLSGRLTDKYRDQFGLKTDEELSYDPVTGQYIGTNKAAVARAN